MIFDWVNDCSEYGLNVEHDVLGSILLRFFFFEQCSFVCVEGYWCYVACGFYQKIMHVPYQVEVQFTLSYSFLGCFLEIEGNVEVEFVLEDAVTRVKQVFEIISMFELIARVLVGYMKMRCLFLNSSLLSLLLGRRVAACRCERSLDESQSHQLYFK